MQHHKVNVNGIDLHYVEEGSGGGKVLVFKGEVVGFDSHYKQGGESKLTVRGFNKMHRMLRGKKSKTWQDKSDQDIVSSIVSNHGLSAKTGSSPKITHKHVYQHNQTDLEFIRTRAARLGFDVWCEGTTLNFDAPKLDKDSGLEFKLDKAPDKKMRAFNVRISNAQCVKKVTVRAWDPEKKNLWVRQPEAISITDPEKLPFWYSGIMFEEFVPTFGQWYAQGEKCAAFVGIRAQESLNP